MVSLAWDVDSSLRIESRVEQVSFWDANLFTLSRQLGVKADFSVSNGPECRVEADG